MPKKFLILGAGRQGAAVAAFLLEQFDNTHVIFADVSAARLVEVRALLNQDARIEMHEADLRYLDVIGELMRSADCVVSCLPFFLNERMTQVAIEAGKSFCDLGGNIGTVRAQMAKADAAKAAGVSIIPDSGLAPGLVSVLAEHWSEEWELRSVKLFCGGLPQNPQGVLRYALTFSMHGLLNEYLDDCQVSRQGKLETIPGLSEIEQLSDLALPGEFEAFATSGGASLGPEVYAPVGVDYQYKTIRYSGHAAIVAAMRDTGLFDTEPRRFVVDDREVIVAPRELVGQILEDKLVSDGRDLVVGRAEVRGMQDGVLKSGRIDLLDYAVDRFTAMERTTGFPTGVVAAALAGLYESVKIEPGVCVPFQVIPAKLMIAELRRAGVTGISVREG